MIVVQTRHELEADSVQSQNFGPILLLVVSRHLRRHDWGHSSKQVGSLCLIRCREAAGSKLFQGLGVRSLSNSYVFCCSVWLQSLQPPSL